jgi:alkylhydroperoxidase family enzyme
MGHCEMLLAVAGLETDAITDRTRRLAEGDWSDFTLAEQAAFAFARKQAKNPAGITKEDVAKLQQRFGMDRALDVIWWSCRCHYMTRVADAFQLPLEKENVFQDKPPSKNP